MKNGLVVPVIRDVDQKSLFVLADELAKISKKARETGLGMNDMQGGCFSISSLGGIGVYWPSRRLLMPLK